MQWVTAANRIGVALAQSCIARQPDVHENGNDEFIFPLESRIFFIHSGPNEGSRRRSLCPINCAIKRSAYTKWYHTERTIVVSCQMTIHTDSTDGRARCANELWYIDVLVGDRHAAMAESEMGADDSIWQLVLFLHWCLMAAHTQLGRWRRWNWVFIARFRFNQPDMASDNWETLRSHKNRYPESKREREIEACIQHESSLMKWN